MLTTNWYYYEFYYFINCKLSLAPVVCVLKTVLVCQTKPLCHITFLQKSFVKVNLYA